MATYQTKVTTELWTKTGSRTGIFPPVGTVLETGAQIPIKERPCLVIIYGDYYNKCVELAAVEPYIPPEPPPPDPTIYVTHTILVYNDGSIDLDGTHYPPNPS